MEATGAVVLIWPLGPRELPRLTAAQILWADLEQDALLALCERVEGNLLAAAQEVEKLALQNLNQPITQDMLLSCLEDTSRFNSFDLIDAAMAGQGAQVSKIMAYLREDKGSLFAVLGALTSQLRRFGQTRGLPPARARTMDKAFCSERAFSQGAARWCALLDQQAGAAYRGCVVGAGAIVVDHGPTVGPAANSSFISANSRALTVSIDVGIGYFA